MDLIVWHAQLGSGVGIWDPLYMWLLFCGAVIMGIWQWQKMEESGE